MSTDTAVSGTKLVDRIRSDRLFSNKIAVSLLTAEEAEEIAKDANELVDALHYTSINNPPPIATAEETGARLTLPPPVTVRNVAHLTKLLQAGLPTPATVRLCDTDVTTEEVSNLINGPLAKCEGLVFQRCLHATGSVPMLSAELCGGIPPAVDSEAAEAGGDHDNGGDDDEAEVADTAVKPPAFVPKVRRVRYLKLQSNPAGTGSTVGEDPNPQTLEALSKLLTTDNTPLHTVALCDSDLASVGCVSIATALLNNTRIECLDLSGNGMGKGDDGAAVTALTQLLQENKFLTEVNLSNNDFDGAQAKQLLEGLINSKTRVATPDPLPEPEPEEYTDELPPEEEAPTVEIGFPKEPEAGEPEGGAPAEGDDGEEAPAEEKEAKVEDAAPAPTNDAEEEDEEAEEAPPAKATTKAAAPPPPEEEEEEDDDVRKQREEAEAEAQRQRYEEAKAAWAEKQEQYIWGPTRIHEEYKESIARREIHKEHIETTTALKGVERASRAEAKAKSLEREKASRERRSGWTHLRTLSLNGNPIGSAGAEAVALLLREKIPLSEEEAQQAEDAADAFVRKATEAAEQAAAAKAEEEKAAKRAARERAAAERNAAKEAKAAAKTAQAAKQRPRDDDVGDDEGVEEEDAPAEEDGQGEAEDGTPRDDAEQPDDAEEEDTAGGEGEGEGEGDGDDDAAASQLPPIPRPDVQKDKPGLQTIEALALNSCQIGSKGLKVIATTLKDNNRSLRVLLLKRNKFGVKHKEVPPPDAKEDDDPPKPNLRVDVPDWVSPGVLALSEALQRNNTLVVLDLSYNGMYGQSLRQLCQALRVNRTLEVLLLDGNHFDEEGVLDTLLQALEGEASVVTTLGLSAAQIGNRLTASTAKRFCGCASLRRLLLDSNALSAAEIGNLAVAVANAPDSWRLRCLHLRNNEIGGSSGGSALAAVAKGITTLQSLRLSGNSTLGDHGFAELACGLQGHPSLQILAASRCGLVNVDQLAASVPGLSLLRQLDLSDNEIQPASALALVEALQHSSSIRALALWGRTVDLESLLIPALIGAVKAVPSFTEVDVGQGLLAVNGPPAAPDPEEPPSDEMELMSDTERLEYFCLKNRLALQGVPEA